MSICSTCAMRSKPKGYTDVLGNVMPVKLPPSPVCQDANSVNYAMRCSRIRSCEDHRTVAYPIQRARVEPIRLP